MRCYVGEHIDDWNVDGDRELSDIWAGFTRFTILKEKPPDGYTWSGRRLTRKNDLQARHIVARNLEKGVRCIETKRETKVDYRETKARQMPEDYVVLTSLILRTKNIRIL